jgi:hypothetical protein
LAPRFIALVSTRPSTTGRRATRQTHHGQVDKINFLSGIKTGTNRENVHSGFDLQ